MENSNYKMELQFKKFAQGYTEDDDSESSKDETAAPKTSIIEEDVDLPFGKDFELLDLSNISDDAWNSKNFRGKIDSLGPDIFKNPRLAAKVEPFKLEWVYGFNLDTNIINLCYGSNQKTIFFNVAQCGVLFDFAKKKMNFLQGHHNKLISISSTDDGKFLATADSGEDNIIIIWERSDISPAMTYFDPYDGQKILSVALSFEGSYLVSVGHDVQDDDQYVRVDFRIWAEGKNEPDGVARIKNIYGNVVKIKFNVNSIHYFAVLFEKAVIFFAYNADKHTLLDPVIATLKSKVKAGNFTDITYVECRLEVLVSSTEGCITFFGSSVYFEEFIHAHITHNMQAIKVCKIAKVAINSIDSADGLIITSDNRGRVSIFDNSLRLLYWYNNYMGKPVHEVRFNMRRRKYQISSFCLNEIACLEEGYFQDDSDKLEIIYKDQLPPDASLMKLSWVVRDFIVVDEEHIFFVDFVKDTHTKVYERGNGYVGAITVHDEFTYLAIGYKNGAIYLIDYMSNFLYVTHKLPEAEDENDEPVVITCLEYSPKALFLACGRSNGEVWILHPVLLKPFQEVLKFSNASVQKIVFSENNDQMAYSNSDLTVYLMIYNRELSLWVYVNKVRFHYKNISQMLFFKTEPRHLMTIGEDKYLIMYNNVDIEQGIELDYTLKVRIDQISIPLACEFYPTKHTNNSPFRYFVMADDQFKYKLVNESTQMCRSVNLGPAYGCYHKTPVTKIKLLSEYNDDYMVFMTKKHFGLQKLPLTGNPYSFVGCYGHPEELLDFEVSGDGDHVFTIGQNDCTVLKWKTQIHGVELMHKLGGDNFEPFYCLIEGGKNGFLFQEMQDLFFYMQILHEGENSTLPRRVCDTLAVSELPDLMRACGYYPSDFEIENFMIDIKYRDFDTTDTLREYISFLEFVRLYVNHKPVYGYSLTKLEETFKILCESADDPTPNMISKDDFLDTLTEAGERFSVAQIHKCLEILLGEGGQSDSDYYSFDFVPEEISSEVFIDEILGIDMTREKVDVDSIERKSESDTSTVAST